MATFSTFEKQNEAYNDENNEIKTKLTEQGDPCNDSKCKEFSVEIIHKDETVLTITIFVTKGRIQIQGDENMGKRGIRPHARHCKR